MANPFIDGITDTKDMDIDTAILYSKAIITDIGNAVAYTDGKEIFVNTEDNLHKLLPLYNKDVLKWILHHEKGHIELNHHKRFYKYLEELKLIEGTLDNFKVTKDEVNIIMDILVHDRESDLFPELVEVVKQNPIQFRNRNVLKYTFTTYTLEEMLTEYAKYKENAPTQNSGNGESEQTDENQDQGQDNDTDTQDNNTEDTEDTEDTQDTNIQDTEDTTENNEGNDQDQQNEQEDYDWSAFESISSREFITESEAQDYKKQIQRIKTLKIKMGRVTQRLNSLATSQRERTYRLPSLIQVNNGCILKGKTPGKTELYLVFDASGSMSNEMDMFKEIITKSIPHALKCPCEWFAGYDLNHKCKVKPYKKDYEGNYYKGTFTDFVPIYADRGYDDDGDRTIELCLKAEQEGYSPIGITDLGGGISWSKDMCKQLKKTVLVGPEHYKWAFDDVRKLNPSIQIILV